MSDLRRLAGYKRLQKVSFVALDGSEHNLEFRVPVSFEALDFHKDYSIVNDQIQFVNTLQKDLRIIPPERNTDMTDEEYDQLVNAYEERLQKIDPEEYKEFSDRILMFNREILGFAIKWLPKVCDEFQDYTEDEIGGVLRSTGSGIANPLILALGKLLGNVENPEEDENLHSLPF